MLPVVTTEGGLAIGVPDMCKVKGVPLPFVNFALARNAEGTSDKVMINNKPVLTYTSTIPCSFGAPPDAQGERSGVANMECTFVKVTSKVTADAQGLVLLSSPTLHNNENCPGIQASSAQSRVLASW